MTRTQLFQLGLFKCNNLQMSHPNIEALKSIHAQIEYLINLENGSTTDRSKLPDIIIGVLTAREIEPLDDDAAEIFYKISSESKLM